MFEEAVRHPAPNPIDNVALRFGQLRCLSAILQDPQKSSYMLEASAGLFQVHLLETYRPLPTPTS